MYEIIDGIMNHNWISQGANEQQYIYYIGGAIIIIAFVCVFDLIKDVFRNFWR